MSAKLNRSSAKLARSSARTATLNNRAWQVQGGVFLTGEKEAYDGGSPNHPVTQGGIGAWELVARYHTLSYDEAAFAGGANSFGQSSDCGSHRSRAGHWTQLVPDPHFQGTAGLQQTRFDGGATVGNRPDGA